MPNSAGIRSPGGKAASARRVVIYRGLGALLLVGGIIIGQPFRDQFIALSVALFFLAEVATVARAVEELAIQGEPSAD